MQMLCENMCRKFVRKIKNMGQSLNRHYVHLVFTTKLRKEFIKDPVETALHKFMTGIIKSHEYKPIIINSVPDHVHILFQFKSRVDIALLVQELKTSSSKWMKTKGVYNFSWQKGYASFSVSPHLVSLAENYIKKQKDHHKKIDVKAELENFFKNYNIEEYDANFYWD
jgi:putative transposase